MVWKNLGIVLWLWLFLFQQLHAHVPNKINRYREYGCIYRPIQNTFGLALADELCSAGGYLLPNARWHEHKSKPSAEHPVIELARLYLGKPYRSGGKGPRAFDCSGFVSFVFRHFGVELPPSSHEQALKAVDRINTKEAAPGDLAFFGYRTAKGKIIINHASIVISAPGQPIKIIHSANGKGICITEIDKSKYWKHAFLFTGKIKHELVAHTEIGALLHENRLASLPLM